MIGRPISLIKRVFKLYSSGRTIREISLKLGIPRSTIGRWLKNTPDHIEELQAHYDDWRKRSNIIAGSSIGIATRQLSKRVLQLQYEQDLKKDLKYFAKNSHLLYKIICVSIYFSRRANKVLSYIQFTTSDSELFATFMKYFRKGFSPKTSKLHIVQVNNGQSRLQYNEYKIALEMFTLYNILAEGV